MAKAKAKKRSVRQRKSSWVEHAWDLTVEFTQERRDELIGLLALVLATALLLSLVPLEPNLLGPLGRAAFRASFGIFGLGSLALPLALGLWGFHKLTRREMRAPSVKAAGMGLALMGLSSLLHLAFPERLEAVGLAHGLYVGGLLGRALGGFLVSSTSVVGTAIISLAFWAVSLYLFEREAWVKNAFLHAYERIRLRMIFRREGGDTAVIEEEAARAEDEADREARLREVAERAVKKVRKSKVREDVALVDDAEAMLKPTVLEDEEAPTISEVSSDEERKSAVEAFLKKRQAIKVSAAGPRVNEIASTDSISASTVAAQPKSLLEGYKLPELSLLKTSSDEVSTPKDYQQISAELEKVLRSFQVEAQVVEVCPGPTVTRYEIDLAPGVKMSRVTSLTEDIARGVKVGSVRIEGPIPGKGTLGIEVPNLKSSTVSMRELLATDEFSRAGHKLIFAVGKDIGGSMIFANLSEMPHLMVAGTTGSGKSVCLNVIITSILFRSAPDEVRFLMIDPKRVELTPYDGIPHLIRPVLTNPKEAAGALRIMVDEMENRYKILARSGRRNMAEYNEWVTDLENEKEAAEPMSEEELAAIPKEVPEFPRLPYIVVVVDELADLMMVSANEVENSIARLAQMARGVGIHLVIATQRPSVDVITGVIKANLPSRIAFQVSSQVDSRTILDGRGAESLLGKGDMLYAPYNLPKPVRVQGCFLSSNEVARVVAHVKSQASPVYDPRFERIHAPAGDSALKDGDFSDVEGAIYEEAVGVVLRMGQGSTSVLQRKLRIGYGKAARLLDKMEAEGLIGPPDGNRPRKVLVDASRYPDSSENVAGASGARGADRDQDA